MRLPLHPLFDRCVFWKNSSSHSKGWQYVLDWYRLWKSDVSGAVRTTYLIPFEWLLNGLRTANRQQRFRVRGHHFFWLSVLTSLNYFSCFLSWYCTKLSDLYYLSVQSTFGSWTLGCWTDIISIYWQYEIICSMMTTSASLIFPELLRGQRDRRLTLSRFETFAPVLVS